MEKICLKNSSGKGVESSASCVLRALGVATAGETLTSAPCLDPTSCAAQEEAGGVSTWTGGTDASAQTDTSLTRRVRGKHLTL